MTAQTFKAFILFFILSETVGAFIGAYRLWGVRDEGLAKRLGIFFTALVIDRVFQYMHLINRPTGMVFSPESIVYWGIGSCIRVAALWYVILFFIRHNDR
jgi:hypothetical protein